MKGKLNKYSSRITQPPSQGASQAMLHATGLSRADLDKAQVGISAVWYEGNSCNMHLNDLAASVKRDVVEAGLVGMRFNTIGVSDGISMGTEGMSYSPQSRDLIADSIETVMSAHWYDANISIPGCDKNMPGCMIAIGRVNRPALMVNGATNRAGPGSDGGKLDVVSAFQSYGQVLAKSIDEDKRLDIVEHACPGAGACGGMYTANTMASAIETMGMSLPYSSSTPAEDPAKHDECLRAGRAIRLLVQKDIKPRDIMTREAFENAMVTIMVLGGSSNGVLHLIAMARTVAVPLSLDDFQSVSNRVPLLADLKPSGQYMMNDLHNVGGTPAVLRYLLSKGVLHGDCMTVTGKTLAENLADLPDLSPGHDVIQPWESPIKETGHLTIMRGNLAPEGSVAKITGKEGLRFRGPAKVFDCEEDMLVAMERGEITTGNVVVIRFDGPKGGPGMPEMLSPTSVIMGAGLGKDVALVTDGRSSGGSQGFIILHIAPEAQEDGPIALVRDGDRIAIDAGTRCIDIELDEAELTRRHAVWTPPPLKAQQGTLFKYIRSLKPASEGCVTDK